VYPFRLRVADRGKPASDDAVILEGPGIGRGGCAELDLLDTHDRLDCDAVLVAVIERLSDRMPALGISNANALSANEVKPARS
jgi:hypothetical protein